MSIASINPATDAKLRTYEEMSHSEIKKILGAADVAFQAWRRCGIAERARPMKAAAQILRNRKGEFGNLMAEEMGKPLGQGEAEVEKCAWVCDYYAENAGKFLQPEAAETDASKSYVTFQPLGVLLAVMPWNFPFWQVFRCAAPGLMAGNAIVLKHASNVSGCALAIEEVFRQAGFPENLFRTLLVGSAKMGDVIANPLVKAVTLTGSVPAGQAIAAQAGRLLKKTVLELGGSDPYIILADANLAATVETCVTARLINSGQSCIAAKRFIVVESVRRQFEESFVPAMRSRRMGDPLDRATQVGPLARRDLRDELHDQVQRSIEQGARLLLGGKIPAGPGCFYPPTVLTDVRPGMPVFAEETFGPVAAIIGADDEPEAIRLANDTVFGLGAAVFTADHARGERIAAEELEAGACFVNAFVKSDPRLPFGGIKQSGYGRELGIFGIREFVNIKTVFVK